MIKVLGTDDSVNTCDCCGKNNLKHTVIVEVDSEILHYGSTCATRHTGLRSGQIKKAIDMILDEKISAAKKEYFYSVEFANCQAKSKELTKAGVRPGVPFADAYRETDNLSVIKRNEIAVKYGIFVYQF